VLDIGVRQLGPGHHFTAAFSQGASRSRRYASSVSCFGEVLVFTYD